MKEWQFNVLFFVGVGGAIFLLFVPTNPTAAAGIGAILTFVLTQKDAWTRNKKKEDRPDDRE